MIFKCRFRQIFLYSSFSKKRRIDMTSSILQLATRPLSSSWAGRYYTNRSGSRSMSERVSVQLVRQNREKSRGRRWLTTFTCLRAGARQRPPLSKQRTRVLLFEASRNLREITIFSKRDKKSWKKSSIVLFTARTISKRSCSSLATSFSNAARLASCLDRFLILFNT